jgi:hypothetical protein
MHIISALYAIHLAVALSLACSVDQRRFELQQQGYVAAFRDPRVLRAIQSGAAQAIAGAIAATPRQLFSGGTSISGIIDYAVTQRLTFRTSILILLDARSRVWANLAQGLSASQPEIPATA